MNWKPALTGAVLVIVAGAAVGVLVGGKTEVETRTVVQTRAPAGVSTAPEAQTPAGADARPTVDDQYLADLEGDGFGENASYESTSAKIGRNTFSSSLVVAPFSDDQDSPASIEFPVTEGFERLGGTFGWSQESSSTIQGTLTVRRDSARGAELYRRDFAGPAEIDTEIDVDLQGAVKVVFVWTTEPADAYQFPDGSFVLGEARFTK
jgi:hypothetical protein